MSKEKKRHHVGRNIVIVLLVVFIGIPLLAVGITYAVFYDGYNATLNVEKNKDMADIFNDLLVDSVEESSTSKNVDFQMNQDTLDTLLYSATSQMDATAKSYIPQLYVEINSDNYDFIAEVSVPMFKTRVHLVTQLSYVEGSTYLENYFLFKIKEIKLGRSSNIDALVKSIASNFIKEADIQSLFDNAGLSLKVDLANNQITYTQGDFIDDIASLLGSGSNSDLLSNMFNEFFAKDLVDYDFYSSKAISAKVDLSTLVTNETYVTEEKEHDIELEKYQGYCESLLDDEIIDVSHLEAFFDYLMWGYAEVGSDTQNYVKDLNLSSIDIDNPSTYAGLPFSYQTDITDRLINQIDMASILSGKLGEITEDDISEVLQCENLVGETYILHKVENDGSHNVNSITFDNMYCNIVDNHVYIVVGVSINGCSTRIILDTSATNDSENYAIKCHIDNIYFGQEGLEDDFISSIYSLLDSALSNQDWVNFDKTSETFTVSFKAAIDGLDPAYKSIIKLGTVSINASGADLSSTGKLVVSYAA